MKTPRILLTAFFAVSFLSVAALAADVAGSWKWTSVTKTGGASEVTAKLAMKDGVLTGSVTSRQGPADITDATFKDGVVAFTVTRASSPTSLVVFKYSGTVEGDTILGTIERSGPNPGPATTTDWKATRTK